jgi:hypothetical protein
MQVFRENKKQDFVIIKNKMILSYSDYNIFTILQKITDFASLIRKIQKRLLLYFILHIEPMKRYYAE